jgi:hypothetical protein
MPSRKFVTEPEKWDSELRAEDSKKVRLHRKAKKGISMEGRSRRRAESDNTEGSVATDGKADPGVERNAAYLDQCISSVLAASNNLEQVSMKLQGVVETLSDSVNLSMSMQQSTQQSLLMHSRPEVDAGGSMEFVDESFSTGNRGQLIGNFSGIQSGQHTQVFRKREVQVPHSNYSLTEGKPIAVSLLKSSSSHSSDNKLEQRSKGRAYLDEEDSNIPPISSETEASLSNLIKQRMHDKLRALLEPELILS